MNHRGGPLTTRGVRVILDDITTTGSHFADLFAGFKPGENIKIYAEVANNTVLTNIAKSVTVTTNSIFGDESDTGKADISNIRHLENLDAVEFHMQFLN